MRETRENKEKENNNISTKGETGMHGKLDRNRKSLRVIKSGPKIKIENKE